MSLCRGYKFKYAENGTVFPGQHYLKLEVVRLQCTLPTKLNLHENWHITEKAKGKLFLPWRVNSVTRVSRLCGGNI